jgi:cellulose synthase (UDP-forming)
MSARGFSLSELFSGARDRVARALGVTRTANAGNWLLRLFFRPPRPGKRDIPAEWAAQVHRRAMTRLGIGKRQGTGTWMWRLFIRPPRPRFRLAADPRKQRSMTEPERDSWLRRWLDRVLEPVWNTTSRLHHQFLSILPRPDWNRVAYSLESLAAQVGRIPFVLPISMVIAAIATVVIGTTPLTFASQMLMFAVV